MASDLEDGEIGSGEIDQPASAAAEGDSKGEKQPDGALTRGERGGRKRKKDKDKKGLHGYFDVYGGTEVGVDGLVSPAGLQLQQPGEPQTWRRWPCCGRHGQVV